MKFKENAIKPGMVIHCPKEEDARALFEKIGQDTENCFWDEYAEKTCYKIRKMPDENFQVSYQSIDYFNSYEITEFSDLIEPDDSSINSDINSPTDSPMTAKEVLEWFSRTDSHVLAEIFDYRRDVGNILGQFTASEIIDRITAYEATKKTPKPVEVEWVDICKIYKLTDEEGIIGECVYEEVLPDNDGYVDYQNAENILKKYISEHEGRYIAMNEDICRVKEDK